MLGQSATLAPMLRRAPAADSLRPFLHLLLVGLVCYGAFNLGALLNERLATVPEGARVFLLMLGVYGPLLGAAMLLGRPCWLGERPSRSGAAAAGLAGAGFLACVGILALAGTLALGGDQHTGLAAVPGMILALLIIAFEVTAEEAMFRGWLQRVLVRYWGVPIGLVASAGAFTAIHLLAGARLPLSLLNIWLAGLFFGLLALRTGGLVAPIAAHGMWNWLERSVAGLDPNPGLDPAGALLDLEVIGPQLWSGGGDGINGSIAASFALAALILVASVFRPRAAGRSDRAPSRMQPASLPTGSAPPRS